MLVVWLEVYSESIVWMVIYMVGELKVLNMIWKGREVVIYLIFFESGSFDNINVILKVFLYLFEVY